MSHCVIDSVLKNSKNGVYIYVGLTKALINQIYATLYSKYAKTNYSFGIFTCDCRSDIGKCRILCTVPHCLEILLLSSLPEHQSLCKKVTYVIFDEMHYMSSDKTWKTRMMLLDSPMIGLSATVNNGYKLSNTIAMN